MCLKTERTGRDAIGKVKLAVLQVETNLQLYFELLLVCVSLIFHTLNVWRLWIILECSNENKN